jgi:high-affinity Fe2+/Pb2+ permease
MDPAPLAELLLVGCAIVLLSGRTVPRWLGVALLGLLLSSMHAIYLFEGSIEPYGPGAWLWSGAGAMLALFVLFSGRIPTLSPASHEIHHA